MKKINILFYLLFFCAFLNAQKLNNLKINYGKQLKNCKSPEGKKLSIVYNLFDLKVGKRDSTLIKVRLPSVSDEVSDFNDGLENPNKLKLSCIPFLSGAKILAIELGDPTIRPAEEKILNNSVVKSNLKSNRIDNPGGKEFCVSVSSQTNTLGRYDITLPLKAKVKFGFLPAVWAKCELKNLYFNAIK